MKNKKLFAILTLVCFMFTLMPVAAFAADTYAEVDSEDAVVKLVSGKAEVELNVTNHKASTTNYYVYAVKADGSLYAGLDNTAGNNNTGTDGVVELAKADTLKVVFADAGEYTMFVTPADTALDAVVANASYDRTKSQILSILKDEAVTMLDNKVTVKAEKSEYDVTLNATGITTNADGDYVIDVDANSGYETKEVTLTLTNTTTNDPVVGATLKISTNSSAVDVNKTEVKTNAAGQAKFKVSASTAGEFKVYVEYGTRADATLVVDAGTLTPAKIETVYAPTAPVALDSSMSATDITFAIYDANGNVVEGVYDASQAGDCGSMDRWDGTTGNYKVAVTEKPVGSTIDADDIIVNYSPKTAVWYLDGTTSFDEEGDYTIKVTLENGNYAVAKVTVKEFLTPVELVMTYKQNTIELGGEGILNKLYYVDANGVTKSVLNAAKEVTEVGLSANGYAVERFDAKTGKVTVEKDEKYVGKTINVLAVSSKYNLTASVELTVANEAAGVKYATNTADVAVNNTIVANIVDVDGNKVALTSTTTSSYDFDIQYIVLDKPANAKVAVSTLTAGDLIEKGQFKVSFTASEIGTYKVQTVVTYNQGSDVVKYYSGIEEITVGNTGFEDVVVLSIGSSTIVVNADAKAIDAAPVVENGRTFVPFRALAEAFGANVAFDEATQSVTAELDGITVVMTIGSATYTVNGVEATADVAPFIVDGRTMVPVRFVAEAFGITVTPTYDENGATADVIFAK